MAGKMDGYEFNGFVKKKLLYCAGIISEMLNDKCVQSGGTFKKTPNSANWVKVNTIGEQYDY